MGIREAYIKLRAVIGKHKKFNGGIQVLNYQLVIMSYKEALEYGFSNNTEPYAVISIRDTISGGYALTFNKSGACKAALNITFDDIEETIYYEGKELHLFDRNDADKIVKFIRGLEELNIDKLVVHCHAGISRSAAVGASILKYYTGKDDEIFNSDMYAPNRWVYRKMLEAFGLEGATTSKEFKQLLDSL